MGGRPPFIAWVNLIYRFNGFHQFIYDFEMLEAVLTQAGFSRVIRSSYRSSEIDELNLDSDIADRAVQSITSRQCDDVSGYRYRMIIQSKWTELPGPGATSTPSVTPPTFFTAGSNRLLPGTGAPVWPDGHATNA